MLPIIRNEEYLYQVPKFDVQKTDIEEFSNELKGFHEQFADCFQRSESRDHFFSAAGQGRVIQRVETPPRKERVLGG